jgi:hypothetical protein
MTFRRRKNDVCQCMLRYKNLLQNLLLDRSQDNGISLADVHIIGQQHTADNEAAGDAAAVAAAAENKMLLFPFATYQLPNPFVQKALYKDVSTLGGVTISSQ